MYPKYGSFLSITVKVLLNIVANFIVVYTFIFNVLSLLDATDNRNYVLLLNRISKLLSRLRLELC